MDDITSDAFDNQARTRPPREAQWHLRSTFASRLVPLCVVLAVVTTAIFLYLRHAATLIASADPGSHVNPNSPILLGLAAICFGLIASIPAILYGLARPFVKLARSGDAREMTVLAADVETGGSVQTLMIAYQEKNNPDAPIRRDRVPLGDARKLYPRISQLRPGDTVMAVADPVRPHHVRLWLKVRLWADIRTP